MDLQGWLAERRPTRELKFLQHALADVDRWTTDGGPSPEPTEPAAQPIPAAEPTPAAAASVAATAADPAFVVGHGYDDGEPVPLALEALRKHTTIFAGSGSGKTVLHPPHRRGVRAGGRLRRSCSTRTTTWPGSARGGRSRPRSGAPGDAERARDYLAHTDVVVWTPRRRLGPPAELPAAARLRRRTRRPGRVRRGRRGGRRGPRAARHASPAGPPGPTSGWPCCARPSSTTAGVADPRLQRPHRHCSPTCRTGSATSTSADKIGREPGTDPDRRHGQRPAVRRRRARRSTPACCSPRRPASGPASRSSAWSACRPTTVGRASSTSSRWRCSPGSRRTRPATGRCGGLLVMDEAQTFAPSGAMTACTQSTLALASQARKYGLGLIFATQSPKSLHNRIPGNAATQFFGLLNSPVQIDGGARDGPGQGRRRAGHRPPDRRRVLPRQPRARRPARSGPRCA